MRREVWLSQALRGKQVKEFSPTIPIDSAIWWGIKEPAASEKSAIWLEFSLASRPADGHNPPVIGDLTESIADWVLMVNHESDQSQRFERIQYRNDTCNGSGPEGATVELSSPRLDCCRQVQ